MKWAAFALGIRITGVIDRVEGGHAVVAWTSDHVSPLPLASLPPVTEGLGISVRIRSGRRGLQAMSPTALRSAAGPVELPLRLTPGRTYRLRFRTHPVRSTRRPTPVASLPDVIEL